MSDNWIPNPRPFPTQPPHDWPAARPATPADPPAPEAEPPSSPHKAKALMVIGVIAVALVAAIVTYLVLRVVRPPKPRAVVPTTAPFTSTTTTTTLPSGPVVTAAELSRLVDELVPFIERTRQLEFTSHPTVLLEDDVTYAASTRDYLARGSAFAERLSDPFEVLGLNPNDADMATALGAFEGDKGVVFYDTVHNIVHVRATPATPYLSTMLVVGLTEQLDDQHFTTDRIAAPTGYGDSTFGMATLVGGDAWRIAAAWADRRPTADQAQIRDELQARRGADTDTARVPAALAAWLRYPADHGVRFTANMVTARSSASLDSVFRSPPDGSAQVLAPARIAAHIDQLEVTTPQVDGTVASKGTFGRFFLEAMFGTLVPEDTLELALNGYRGDTLVVYENEQSGTCVRMDVTTGDAAPDNMNKAMTAWASARNGSVQLVDDPERDGRRLVRLDVCSGGGGTPDSTTTTTIAGAQGTDPSSTIPGGPRP